MAELRKWNQVRNELLSDSETKKEYEFCVYQMTVEDHNFWVAESRALKGCVGQGETSQEAIEELEQNEKEWLATPAEVGIPIPAPIAENTSSDCF